MDKTSIPPGIRPECFGKRLTAVYTYRRENGDIVGHVARYDGDNGEKDVIPYFVKNGTGWKSGAHPEPRPLYGLDRLAANPGRPVLIVEGEKCVDALQGALGNEWVVVTWPGGTGAVKKADWAVLFGRTIFIWPDNDEPGIKAAQNVGQAIAEVG